MNRIFLFLACLAALNGPAQAGLFDDEEARRRITSMEQDFAARNKILADRLDAQAARIDMLEAGARNVLQFLNQMELLRQEIAKLRGQIEVAAHNVELSDKRQKDFYVDLDARLRKLETDLQKATASVVAPSPAADPAAEARDYENGLTLLKAGKAVQAAIALKGFTISYPKSAQLPNAHFWLAAAYAKAQDHEAARDTYGKFISTWSNDAQVPYAMLAMADSQTALKEVKGARATLEALATQYPDHEAGKAAKQRLAKK